MSAYRRNSPAVRIAIQLAAAKAEAVWNCLSILDPDLKGEAKKAMAKRMLTLVDGVDRSEPPVPPIRITARDVEGIFWQDFQCVHRKCGALLFSRQIAESLNEFFGVEPCEY